MASGELQIWKIDGSGNVDYQLVAADSASVWVKTRPIDLQDARTKKHLRRLLHDIKGAEEAESLVVELYSKKTIDGAETLQKSLNVADSNPLKFRFPNCRYVVAKFLDDDVGYIWALSGFELWGTLTSKRF
jgi:hypothetical protein